MKTKITLLLFACSIFGFSQTIQLQEFATGFTDPVEIVNAGDARLFVVQQGGTIKIVNADGVTNSANFLSLPSSVVQSGGERGLLGLAFHPQYATNGFFYVNYTRAGDGATVIAKYSRNTTNPDIADPASGVVLLTVDQPFANHNGGTIRFGADGFLYIGMGDGGSANDPGNRAQNINENLGKMLRIDVNTPNGSTPYSIPVGNPYAGTGVAGNDEIWAIGLRNPWKYSFDRLTGDLWIADVGQNEVEEINHVSSFTEGLNYGWKCYEGDDIFTQNCAVAGTTYTFPVATYPHTGGNCSITGGYVYTGSAYPNLLNKYIFADYCVNRIGMVNTSTNAVTYSETFSGSSFFTTFGQDVDGELYVAASTDGTIYKITDTSLSTQNFGKMSFSVSPNPATSEINLKLDNANFPASVKFYDIAGKLLMNANVDQNRSSLSVGALQSGMYIVTVTDKTGATSNTKLTIK